MCEYRPENQFGTFYKPQNVTKPKFTVDTLKLVE